MNALVKQHEGLQHYYGVNEDFDPVDAFWTLEQLANHRARGGKGVITAVYTELAITCLTQCHIRLDITLQGQNK